MMKREFWEKCEKEQLVDYIMWLQDHIKMSAELAKEYRALMRSATFKQEVKHGNN
jgi:hypothetical protein